MHNEDAKTPIQVAVDLFDSQQLFADAISRGDRKVGQAQVSHWYTGFKKVPAHHCIPIQEATNNRVTCYDLRPDIFGEPDKAA